MKKASVLFMMAGAAVLSLSSCDLNQGGKDNGLIAGTRWEGTACDTVKVTVIFTSTMQCCMSLIYPNSTPELDYGIFDYEAPDLTMDFGLDYIIHGTIQDSNMYLGIKGNPVLTKTTTTEQ